jgi:hypothetical protein
MLTSSFLFFPFFHFHPFFLILSMLLYFLPALLARDKPSFTAIFLVNLFAGWTFIGWIIALIWAVTAEPKRQAPTPFQQATVSAPQPAASAGFFCSACGKRSPAGGRFCSSCGATLSPAQR